MSPDDDDFLRIMSNATFYQGVTLPSGKFLTHEEHEALKAIRRGKSSGEVELDATLKAISDEIEELKKYTGLSRREEAAAKSSQPQHKYNYDPYARRIGDMKRGDVGWTVPWAFDSTIGRLRPHFTLESSPGGTATMHIECQRDGLFLIQDIEDRMIRGLVRLSNCSCCKKAPTRIPRPKKPVDPLLLENWLEKPEGWPGWSDSGGPVIRRGGSVVRMGKNGAWTLRDGKWVDDDKIPLESPPRPSEEQAKREAKKMAKKKAEWEAEKAKAEADKIAQDLLDKAKPPAWDPLGVAPFAWDLPEPGPAPVPRPSGAKRVTTFVRDEGFAVNIYAVLVLLYFSLTILSLATSAWLAAGIDVFIMIMWMYNVRMGHKRAVVRKQSRDG